ncbi:MAG: GNAT family N-acetyltransferase [Clostridium sp.]|nr:GNAT family N-acetyltransferase [Clostridium sp.]
MLSDGKIILRPLEPEDIDFVYRLENDTDAWEHSLTSAPFSRRMLTDYVLNATADIYADRQLRLVVTETRSGELLGLVDLFEFDPLNRRAGVGIIVAPESRHRGTGLSALGLLGEYASRRLGIHTLWAVTAVDNAASRCLFERAGYQTTGRLRSWLRRGESYADALLWQRLFGSN